MVGMTVGVAVVEAAHVANENTWLYAFFFNMTFMKDHNEKGLRSLSNINLIFYKKIFLFMKHQYRSSIIHPIVLKLEILVLRLHTEYWPMNSSRNCKGSATMNVTPK